MKTRKLFVYRDFIHSKKGYWRLWYEDMEDGEPTGLGVHADSEVTGQPWFRTMREAIAHGERQHGETATRLPKCLHIGGWR